MDRVARQKICRHVLCLLIVLCLSTIASTSPATDLSPEETRATVNESIKAILTGQAYSPALAKNQLALRKMFEANAVSKTQLISMVEKSMMPILDAHQQKASVDIFKEVPARVEALLSPYMTWPEVKEAGLRIASPLINESIKDLLTGQPFSPELEQKQLVVRKMFEAGLISKEECIAIVEAAIIPILEHYKTSRYILKDMPKRVEALLAPYMTWEEVKKVTWKVGSSMVKDGDQVVLTIGTLAPPGTPWMNVPETVLIPRMAQLSDNKFIVKIYGGGVMGEDTDILRKIDIGQLDGCGCTALGILAASPEASVFLLPGMFNNYYEIDYITEKFRQRIDKAFEEKGYILAAIIDTGFFYLFSKNRITSLADLKKQRLITWFGDIETTLYHELGVDATPVAVPETISALSTGMGDTNLAPAAWMLGMQAYQYTNYYIKQPILYSPAAVIISLQTKERLRKRFGISEIFAHNVQEMLIYEVSTLEQEWKEISRNYEKKCLDAFEKKCGMKVIELSPEDRKIMEQAYLRVQGKLADKIYPRDLMNDIKNALKEYRSRK